MVQLFRTDLQFILDQIILAENGNMPPTAFHPWGLRTVNGVGNHVIPGQETWGSADQLFPRLLTPVWRSAGVVTMPVGPGQALGSPTSYLQTTGFVFDPQIRLISNLIVDQTPNNPAAVEVAFGSVGLAGGGNIPGLQAQLAAAQTLAADEADDLPPLQAAVNSANAISASTAAAAAAAQAQANSDAAAAATAQANANAASAAAANALATLNALLAGDVDPVALANAQTAYDNAVAASNAADAAATAAASTAAASQAAATAAANAATDAAANAVAAQAALDAALAAQGAAQTAVNAATAGVTSAVAAQASADADAATANANLVTANAALADANTASTNADSALVAANNAAAAAAQAAVDAQAAEDAATTALADAQGALDALIASGTATVQEIADATALRDQRQTELTTATTASNVADADAAAAAQTASDASNAAALAAAALLVAQGAVADAQTAANAANAAAAAAAQAVIDANAALTQAQTDLDAANALVVTQTAARDSANTLASDAQTAATAAAAQAALDATAAANAQDAASTAAANEQLALDALTALQNQDIPQATIDAAQSAYDTAAANATAAAALASTLASVAAVSSANAAALVDAASAAAANAAAALGAYNTAVAEANAANAAVSAAQAALDAALAGSPIVQSPGLDGVFGTGDDRDVFFIPNTAPDAGLSAPFNSWFTLFGQFFDHGLDLVNKGGSGTVVITLLPDDPLYDFGGDGVVSADDGFGADGVANTADDSPNFMMLTRATNMPGPDGILGTADDIREHNNQTTPFIDQNQTYTSHPSHQVFLREYALNGNGDAVSTGRFLDGAHGGLATWADIKNQARDLLGVLFSDHDVLNIPLIMTDAFGRFIPGANGYVQIGVRVANGLDGLADTADDVIVFVEGVAGGLDINDPAAITAALAAAGSSFTTGTVVRIDHAFLDDIAHSAAPGTWNHDNNPATPAIRQTGDADNIIGNNDGLPGTYDDDLLNVHFITGDGRGNENIGLTAVHTIFHAEHNRLVGAIHDEVRLILATDGISDFVRGWVLRLPGETDAQLDARILDGLTDAEFNGERVFQAARVFTEMQYQHLVFEEFARKIHPGIDIFINIDMTINPAIFAEFAHVVYRFGHSMLTETIDRFDANFDPIGAGGVVGADQQQIGLIAAFLNPMEFVASGADAAEASAAIIRGMTRQSGNAIDEFITEALRNNLVGLPLDLAALNLARGRDAGIPGLNEARRQFYAMTGDSQLTPYISWIDFAQNVKHPASVINFIAAYGTHALITAETTMEGRRAAAMAIVTGVNQTLEDGRVIAAPTDALAFLNATGAYAGGSLGGLENVDFWIGGLAELAPEFGSMLGTTFAFVFETQLESLQNGDRFYYLARFSGQNFLAELEGNSFASLIMRNTDLVHLPGDVFATPDWTLEVNPTLQHTELGVNGNLDPTWADEGLPNNIFIPLVSRDNPLTAGPDTNYIRYNGAAHVVFGGTDGDDVIIAGGGDDTVWGDGGNDRIEGGNGFDILNGGDGNDIITDSLFDGNIKGGDGDDVIHAGDGIDLVIGGRGNDFVNLGTGEGDEVFAGLGNDFITGDGTLTGLVGGFGDDWVESAFGIGGLTGDNADVDGAALNFAGEDINGGHDILIGGGAPNDFDSFGGDDIMVSGMGTDRLEGFIGFDWVSYQNNTQFGGVADMEIRIFGQPPLPGDPGATLDRFDMVEGMSGSQLDDVLRGDDRVADPTAGIELALTGHEMNAAGIARITGMGSFLGQLGAGVDGVVGTADDMFTGGNIILGGGGSDIMEGRGGNDVIDGDAYLTVAIGVDRNLDGDFNDPNERVTTMDALTNEMLAGTLQVSQLGLIREINYAPTEDIDTAVFTGNRADYFIEGQDTFEGISDQDGDGFIQVIHLVRDGAGVIVDGQVGIDGIDYLRSVERLQFNDTIVQIGDVPNEGPVGVPTISDTTPAERQTLTANVTGVTDPDNISTNGVITGLSSITWQADNGDGIWRDIMVVGGANGNEGPVPATGATFTVTQDQANAQIRVRYNYIDENGVLETVFSAPTAAVTPINDAPIGALVISDPTPTEGDILTANVAFIDPDGTTGAVFTFQWQQQLANGTWQNIAGATLQQFIPGAAQIGLPLRAIVSYTDDFGTTETVTSAATSAVGDFITGTNAGNTLTGTAFSDRIQGLGGADILNGGAGSDVLEGGAGGDTLNGNGDADFLFGEGGADTLNGDAGDDTLNGGAGADAVNGGAGNDTIQYALGDGADTMNGGADTDTLSIVGTAGDDTLTVRYNGTRIIEVEGGGISNIEVINANLQAGSDTLSYATTAAAVAVAVNLSTGVASGMNTLAGIENVTGGLGNDTIVGNGGANILTGLNGADTIDGGLGDDIIVATTGDGSDSYNGGAGIDFYNLANTTANATVNLATGTATSTQTGTDSLINIEGVLGGFGADNLTGSNNADILDGGAGADTINGGAGNDTLSGGAGNGDVVNGGAGNDLIIYNFGDGTDNSYDGGADTDTLRINGTAGADTLTAVWNGTRLTSFTGATTLLNIEAVTADLLGGADRLSYTGTLAANGVTVDLGAGTASGFTQLAGIENVTGGAGNDSITGDGGANDIDGAGGADALNGGDGNDNLSGGGGNDTLIGGLGNDAMNGNAGNDTFVFSGAFGADTITGFDEDPAGGQDRLDVSGLGVTAANFGATVAIAQQGANVLVTINGQSITLIGETAASITQADFILGGP